MSSDTERARWADKKVFTTGEAAEICKVSQQTIIRCFDAGRLQGFRVPGSKFRRIPRDELIRFMRANDIPTDALEGETRRVLVVDDDAEIIAVIRDVLKDDGRFEVCVAQTGYEAGMLTEAFRPHVLVLDYMLPDINGDLVCRQIREREELSGTRVLVVSGVVRREEIEDLLRSGADDFIRKPFNADELIDKVATLAGLEAGRSA